MKKVSKYLVIAGMTAAVAATPMTSYGFSFWGSKAKAETTAAAVEEKTYDFKVGETVISMGAESAPVIKALGKAEDTFETDSCAYQGKDIVYMYKGYDLSTYPVSGKYYISSVYFTDNTVSTPEGIKIGSTTQDVINAYGKDYEESFGVYRYKAGKTELAIYTTNGVVDAVEYLVITEQ